MWGGYASFDLDSVPERLSEESNPNVRKMTGMKMLISMLA